MGGCQVITVWGRLKGRRRVSALLCTLFLGVSVCVSGCSAGYEDACVLEGRIPTLNEGAAPVCFVDAPTSDPCVVTDENGFDADFATSEAATLFDISDREVLCNKRAFEKLYPVSVAKVMTTLVAIREGDLSSCVHVTEDVVITESGVTLYGTEPGGTLILEQLLYSLTLPSGNDAGAAIAVHIMRSVGAPAGMMDEEALRLGATDTHFVNPHRLSDSDHCTTAYDLYLIFNGALKYPAFRQIMGTTAYMANYHNKNSGPVTRTQKGGNWFIVGGRGTPDGLKVFGGETGTAKAAGYYLIMASRDDSDKEYISVVLKVDSRPRPYDNVVNIASKIVKQ